MKKLFNKLSNSGNLKEETQFTGEEHFDTHVRKSANLPSEPKDVPEEFKLKKSFSLSKATSPRFKEAMESEDFSKKKSSSNGVKKEKIKDKLNESDDKLVRKSKSEKSVKSPNSIRSPSLKSIFASPYEHQRDAKGVMADSSSDEEEDAFVPHQHADIRDDNNDDYNHFSTPIRVPSAPARMATSTSFSSSSSPSLSPIPVSLHVRATSPTSSLPPSSSPTRKTPTSFLPPSSSSPPSFFTQSPPTHALVPTPHVIVADEFETTFGARDNNNNNIERFGVPIKFLETETRLEDKEESFNNETENDEDEILHQKNKSGGLFSFGSNKPMKLKA